MTNVRAGHRIRLVEMPEDPDPVPAGSLGTVRLVQEGVWRDGALTLTVVWDNGRSLNIISPPDRYEIVRSCEKCGEVDDVGAHDDYDETWQQWKCFCCGAWNDHPLPPR